MNKQKVPLIRPCWALSLSSSTVRRSHYTILFAFARFVLPIHSIPDGIARVPSLSSNQSAAETMRAKLASQDPLQLTQPTTKYEVSKFDSHSNGKCISEAWCLGVAASTALGATITILDLVRWEPLLSAELLFCSIFHQHTYDWKTVWQMISCLFARYRKIVVNSPRYIAPVCARKIFLVGVLRNWKQRSSNLLLTGACGLFPERAKTSTDTGKQQ